jgi:glycosyltransferase involved in cell wall biosynthesis
MYFRACSYRSGGLLDKERNTMKIAMVMSVYGKHAIGGAERTAGILANNLVSRGHKVSIVSLGAIGSQESSFETDSGVVVWQLPLSQIYDPYGLDGVKNQPSESPIKKAIWHLLDIYNLRMASRIRTVFTEIMPDVVMTHTLQGLSVAIWSEASRVGAKIVHMTHDHALICPSTAMTKGAKVCESVCSQCSVYSKMRHALSTSPDVVVGPSQIILDRHHRFGWFNDVKETRVIPNALPENWPDSPAEIKTQSPMVFGFLGRLDESKGIDTLLSAVNLLPKGSFKIKLGGQGDGKQLRERWLDSKVPPESVEFMGVVNAAEFLSNIDVLVTPSRAHETFCNVVMEAGCLGRPAIVSNRGALPERVEHGNSGWIFPAGDSQELAKLMNNCINHPQDVRSKGGNAQLLRDSYSSQVQCDRFETLFQELTA